MTTEKAEPLTKDVALALVSMYDEAMEAVRKATFPRLLVVQHIDPEFPEDGEFTALQCPYCDSVGTEGTITCVDSAERHTVNDDIDVEERVVPFDYDSDVDWAGLYLMCANCGNPVSLPEGWTEQ